jgi:hypothetical protein
VFSAVDGILLRPLPFPDAEDLVNVWPNRSQTYRDVEYLAENAASLTDVAAMPRTRVCRPRLGSAPPADARESSAFPDA